MVLVWKNQRKEKDIQSLREINFPIKGIRRTVAGVIAKDSNNDYYILHRGKLGGNYCKKDFVREL